MRMRDAPGLGRGGEGIVCSRPCRGVSDEAEDERLVFHADRFRDYWDPDLTLHATLSLAQDLGSTGQYGCQQGAQ